MAASQKTADGAKSQTLKVQFQGLPFEIWMFPSVGNRLPIDTFLTPVSLLSIDNSILDTFFRTTFWTTRHFYASYGEDP